MTTLEIADNKFIKLTYGVVIALMMGVGGFAAWMTSMEARTQDNTVKVEAVENKSDLQLDLLHSIDKRLYVLENYIKGKKNE